MITIAKILAVVFALLGIAGLIAGEQPLKDIIHLLTAGLLFYAIMVWSTGKSRKIFTVLGIAYILFGTLGFFAPTLYGLVPHGLSQYDNALHAILGLIMIDIGTKNKDWWKDWLTSLFP